MWIRWIQIRIWIRIHNTGLMIGSTLGASVGDPDPHVLGLLDPDPDPSVRGMDPYPAPDLDPSIINHKK